MKVSKSKITILILVLSMALLMTGCNSDKAADSNDGKSQSADVKQSEAQVDLKGHSLMIYCGAGMKAPMTEIVDNFKAATGCEVDLTFGNGAQINSQIVTTNQGDLFIAGASTELENLKNKDLIADSKDLVKHIPVIVTPKGNKAGISSISDLGKVRLVLGDAEATPIGKIANAVLKDAGLSESANIIARTSTAPEMITALSTGEADAAIVWKENAEGKEGIEILDIEGMDKYIKTIPAASLSCSADKKALDEFLKYLDTDEAHNVWTAEGYVVI